MEEINQQVQETQEEINEIVDILQEEKEDNEDNNETVDTVQEENTNCLALAIKEEYNMTIAKNIMRKFGRVSWKVLINMLIMNFLNFFL